jgi:putative oxidoreductase
MKIISVIPRILLGLMFGVMPWLAILHLGPNPPMPPAAIAFIGALLNTGYMMPLVWGTEILAGLLILLGIFVPFALVMLTPILVNILFFHAFLAPTGAGIAIIACLLAFVVAWQYRRAFDSLFVWGSPGA